MLYDPDLSKYMKTLDEINELLRDVRASYPDVPLQLTSDESHGSLIWTATTVLPHDSSDINHESSAESKNEDQVFLTLYDPKKNPDVSKLNELIKAGIGISEEQNTDLKPTYVNMVEWLEKYVKSEQFIKMYSDEKNLELVAEATFWTVNLGLDKLIAKMSHQEISKFQPMTEGRLTTTERTTLINKVCDKLTKPAFSFESSYALGQAAWAVYVKNNSYEKLIAENEASTQERPLKKRKM